MIREKVFWFESYPIISTGWEEDWSADWPASKANSLTRVWFGRFDGAAGYCCSWH
jgi:hypothetical protein